MVFILFILLFFLPTNVWADDFTTSGDGVINLFFSTIAFSGSDMPSNCSTSGCVEYDLSSLSYTPTDVVLSNGMVPLVGFGGMRRLPLLADRVSLPPGALVDLIYLYSNETGHPVDISRILVPLTKNDINQGNLLNLVEISQKEVTYSFVDVVFNNKLVRREGYLLEYEGVGLVGSGSVGGIKLGSVRLKNPLKISQVEANRNQESGDILITFQLENSSPEYLIGISIAHHSYTEEFDMPAFSSRDIVYSLDLEHTDIGQIKIYNPNRKVECATLGGNYYAWTYSGAASVLSFRQDGGWINGAYLQPVVEGFCVERIPYAIYSEGIFISTSTAGEDDVEKEEHSVAGISSSLKVLPKTGTLNYFIFLFIVVDGYLWYSFIKELRKYEREDNNTRVCSKDCENPNKGRV